jgi:hypothetical protein
MGKNVQPQVSTIGLMGALFPFRVFFEISLRERPERVGASNALLLYRVAALGNGPP